MWNLKNKINNNNNNKRRKRNKQKDTEDILRAARWERSGVMGKKEKGLKGTNRELQNRRGDVSMA